MIRTLSRIAIVSLAVVALAAPAAVARPDAPSAHAVTSEFLPRPVLDRPSAPASSQPAGAPAKAPARHTADGVDWTPIGIGLVGGLLIVGAAVGVVGRARRVGGARAAA